MAEYTTGHCPNHNQPGGCQLHNLQCGWPNCDRRQVQHQPAAAASVSERARAILKSEMGGFGTDTQGRIPLEYALRAIEQALTQQRGECEICHGTGEGGGVDGDCALCGGRATTPQPSADAVRELVKRWRGYGKDCGVSQVWGKCADELESLLSGGSHD